MLTLLLSFIVRVLASLLGWIFSPLSLAIIAAGLGIVYYLITKNYDYWPSRGVPGPKAQFPWGTEFGHPLTMPIRKFMDWLYFEQGGKKYCGFIQLHKPVLVVGDLDLIRCITIKDFEHFTDRRDPAITSTLNKSLPLLRGQEWKHMRSAISPTFSSSKMHGMHQLTTNNAENLPKYMLQQMSKGEVDLMDAFGRFTMDNIALCAFGVNCNSFTDPNTEFAKNAGELFKPPSAVQAARVFLALTVGQRVAKLLPDPIVPAAEFFAKVVSQTRKQREATGSKKKDFLQLLLDTKDKDGNRLLTDKMITVQCVLFLIAGFKTTSVLLTFAAYCLTTEPEWQRRVHEELDQVLENHNGELTYEAVGEMTLLNNFLSETSRLYPLGFFLERECTKDYILPGTDIKIPKGFIVKMPVFSLHRDPDIYPEPLKFDPDRFLPSAKEARHPCAYMPFGSGPRNCIAMRFALLEAKVALAVILQKNRFEPSPNTPLPPLPLADEGIFLFPKEGCAYARLVPRT